MPVATQWKAVGVLAMIMLGAGSSRTDAAPTTGRVGRPASGRLPSAKRPPTSDHGIVRARLDPAHTQRIITITDDGDQGLIALTACQAYVREVSH